MLCNEGGILDTWWFITSCSEAPEVLLVTLAADLNKYAPAPVNPELQQETQPSDLVFHIIFGRDDHPSIPAVLL